MVVEQACMAYHLARRPTRRSQATKAHNICQALSLFPRKERRWTALKVRFFGEQDTSETTSSFYSRGGLKPFRNSLEELTRRCSALPIIQDAAAACQCIVRNLTCLKIACFRKNRAFIFSGLLRLRAWDERSSQHLPHQGRRKPYRLCGDIKHYWTFRSA